MEPDFSSSPIKKMVNFTDLKVESSADPNQVRDLITDGVFSSSLLGQQVSGSNSLIDFGDLWPSGHESSNIFSGSDARGASIHHGSKLTHDVDVAPIPSQVSLSGSNVRSRVLIPPLKGLWSDQPRPSHPAGKGEDVVYGQGARGQHDVHGPLNVHGSSPSQDVRLKSVQGQASQCPQIIGLTGCEAGI